jgi:excisionase family DNA binding protein
MTQSHSFRAAQRLLSQPKAKLEVVTAQERRPIPAEAKKIMARVLEALERGKTVQVLESDAVLSTHQAAKLLDMSRPHLIDLLEQNEIPHFKVGSHRRIKLEDALAFKAKRKAARLQALRELAIETKALGLDR